MTTLEAAVDAAFAIDTPQRARARMMLALANAAMAGIIGGLTFGPGEGVLAALVMLVQPYLAILAKIVPELVKANKIASSGAAFISGVAAGSVVWGIQFAFAFALVLAPTMLAVVAWLARANSLVDD